METKKSGMWGWLLQRITGFLLAIGLIVHYVFVHFLNKGELTSAGISTRLGSPWWYLFDVSLLAIILYHGFYGVLGIVNDYNPDSDTRKNLFYFFLVIGIVLFFWGAASLFKYKYPVGYF